MDMKYYILLYLVLAIWSTSSTMVSIITRDANPLITSGIVVFISFIFLLILMLKKINRDTFRRYGFAECSKVFVPGFIGLFLYPILYFMGISGTDPIKANILNYLWPLFAVGVDWFINKNVVNTKEKISFFLAFLGAYIVMFSGAKRNMHLSPFGNKYEYFALGGALTYGIYTAIIKNNIPEILAGSDYYDKACSDNNNMPAHLRMFLMVSVATVCHFIIFSYYLLFDRNEIKTTISLFAKNNKNMIVILIYSIVNYTVAHLLWNMINKNKVTTSSAGAAYIIPVASTILLSKYYGTPIGITAAIGLEIIVLSIILSNKERINSFSLTILVSLNILVLCDFVPVVNNVEIKTQSQFFLEILIALFAIYYGFTLNRIVNSYNKLVEVVDSLRIKKQIFSRDKSEKNLIDQLEKKLMEKIGDKLKYDEVNEWIPHIGDYFSEDLKDETLEKYYNVLFRASEAVLSLSEIAVIIILCALILIHCFIVRQDSMVSDLTIITIGATICLCISSMYEYTLKKESLLKKFIGDGESHYKGSSES